VFDKMKAETDEQAANMRWVINDNKPNLPANSYPPSAASLPRACRVQMEQTRARREEEAAAAQERAEDERAEDERRLREQSERITKAREQRLATETAEEKERRLRVEDSVRIFNEQRNAGTSAPAPAPAAGTNASSGAAAAAAGDQSSSGAAAPAKTPFMESLWGEWDAEEELFASTPPAQMLAAMMSAGRDAGRSSVLTAAAQK
jgi:hypothetical protein